MHEYDVALKRILTRPGSVLLTALTGFDRLQWLNVETPTVRNLRVDALGKSPDENLVQIELQSRNEKHLPMRMGEYLFGIGRTHGRLPRQIVLYVGDAKLRMKDWIETPDVSYRFHLVDIRDLDGETLMASRNLGDNVIAVLTRLGSQPDTVRRILERIANRQTPERDEALAELLIVAGLRRMTGAVKREAKRMPILNDIMDNEVFGPLIRQGRAEGRAEGKAEGKAEGRAEGQREILLGLIEKRFGRVPPRLGKRLAALKPEQIKAVGLRLLDAQRIEDLFAK